MRLPHRDQHEQGCPRHPPTLAALQRAHWNRLHPGQQQLLTLYVVTHPEATHHVEGVVGGWHDSQLTPAGVRAAVSIAQALRAQIPDGAEVELFSPDLQRCGRPRRWPNCSA
ncbi:histidine phosphatase family protein [Streptomyces sp. JV184]|uniref:histidine phosphatase family protein n=1 Tax=Streptomyces sp. JV184 TaxID=858637 RepID=UPI002E770CED|nr:histidine phosphatase family protein [Streptomyces sp. JV184]